MTRPFKVLPLKEGTGDSSYTLRVIQSQLPLLVPIWTPRQLWRLMKVTGMKRLNTHRFRAWYHFYVTGIPLGETIDFVIKNMSNQSKLYSFGMRPFFKEVISSDGYNQTAWQPLPPQSAVSFTKGIFMNFPECLQPNDYSQTPYELAFTHKFGSTSNYSPNSRTYFAYCEPYSYTDCQQ